MNHKKKFCLFFAVVAGFFIIPHGFALNIEDFVGAEQVRALIAGEKPVMVQFSNIRPRLMPNHASLREILSSIQRSLNPSVMVETLHLYEKPAAAEKTAWTEKEESALFNNLLALSTLEGIEYYSATRETMRTFYETSSVIDGPSTKKQIADPMYPRPPAQLTVYARQKDLTFGDNIYQYDYYSVPGAFIFNQINLTRFFYGIIPVLGKENLRSTVAIIDAGRYILVYASSMAKAASIPGIKDRMGNSFSNRAAAIGKWFGGQADKAFAEAH